VRRAPGAPLDEQPKRALPSDVRAVRR
jgi:hypothetical protein